MASVKLSAPWITFNKMVKALFNADPEITVGEVYGDDEYDYGFDILVKSHEKYMALDRVMPKVREFGTVSMAIRVFDEENNPAVSGLDIYETLFKGNPILKDIKTTTLPDQCTTVGYVRFQPEVIQFFNDDISDFSGNWSGLASDIAKVVFDEDTRGIYFCTASVKENEELF